VIFRNPGSLRVYIRPGRTDMRKAINGLSMIVQENMNRDPFAESLFVFCGRSKNLIKILYWDGNGFCLWQKRLEKGIFPWPHDEGDVKELQKNELIQILSGIDFRKKHHILNFQKAG
jgi:transposase